MAATKQPCSKLATSLVSAVDVYVKLPSGRTFRMDMEGSSTVRQICERVAREESVPEDRVNMKYTGKVLNKSSTVAYLGICAETILKAEILQVRNYDLFVQLPDGRTLSLNIENVSPVSYIKDQIHVQAEVLPGLQILKQGDRSLTNMKQTLVAAGITNESILTLEIKEEGAKKKSAKRPTSRTHSGAGSDSPAESDSELTDGENNTQIDSDLDKEAILNTFDAAGKPVEVIFSFDTTGSMYSCLEQVRNNLKSTIERLLAEIPSIRIGIMAQGDYCDYKNYVVRTMDLTSDVQELVTFVQSVPSTGGGDAPECYEWVLHKACHMDWSEDSAKALVVIGDDKPHPASYTDQLINWHDQLDLLKGMGVKVYGVRAQNSSGATPFYQELAYRTGGAYIEFKNFSIITEMFMAVCYREASNEQFEAYCEELGQNEDQAQGQSSEVSEKVKDIQKVINQLKEQKDTKPEEKIKHYVASPWWDCDLDFGTPSYSYNGDRDRWMPYVHQTVQSKPTVTVAPTSVSPTPVTTSTSRRTFSFRQRQKGSNHARNTNGATRKSKCVIM